MGRLPKIVIITGPTASGKSSVAIDVAGHVGGEIVSADSAAVYRGMDIGTAKPTAQERERVPHHLINLIDPDRRFNAMAYRRLADDAVTGIMGRGRVPIMAGGTGLYLKALLFGLIELPDLSGEGREVRRELEAMDTSLLTEELSRVDPLSAERINKNDRVRIIRAVEIYRMTGIPKSMHEAGHGFTAGRYDALTFGLSMKRDLLYERIDRRVDEMFRSGIVREVEGLLERGYGPGSPGLATIGYKEVVDYLEGKTDLETAISLIKRNTRRFAKRQITWLGKVDGIKWIEHPYDINRIVQEIHELMLR